MIDLQNFGEHLKFIKDNQTISEKDTFIDIVNIFDKCNKRTGLLEQEFNVDLETYENPFFLLIENLLAMAYGENEAEIILWWVYDRFDEEGNLLSIKLNFEDEGIEEDVMVETAEELWDLLEKLKN